MPARAPATRQAVARSDARTRAARRACEVRRRRGHVLGRPFVHPPVGLPDVVGEGSLRSAEGRSGRDRPRRLRRLRALRRECARRCAVSVVLSRRSYPEPELARSPGGAVAPGRDPSSAAGLTMIRAISILIGALGGQGGGVLAEWLVDAAAAAGFPAQSTSIPGVAQRTGATTYYVEIFPQSIAALAGRAPVLGLYPVPGSVDLLIA